MLIRNSYLDTTLSEVQQAQLSVLMSQRIPYITWATKVLEMRWWELMNQHLWHLHLFILLLIFQTCWKILPEIPFGLLVKKKWFAFVVCTRKK
jgi:hypothetical protein